MSTSRRARLSVAVLAGCYLVAAAQLAAVVALVLLLIRVLPTTVALGVAVPLCIATVGALAYGLRFLRTRHRPVAGITVTRADAPALWSMCDELAAGAAAPAPATITVVADADLRILERYRLLGLLPGRRDLVIGLPVLLALDTAHIRAAIAHDLAHGTTGPAATAWRGGLALDRAVARAGPRNPAGWVLRAWAGLYHHLADPVVHAHELAADRYAAVAAGPRAAADVLHDLPMLCVAQDLFHAEYVGPGWQAGHVPDDVFGGFLRVLAARAGDLARWRPDEGPSGTHPALADRLAAIGSVSAASVSAASVSDASEAAASAGAASAGAASAGAASEPAASEPAASAAGVPAVGVSAADVSAADVELVPDLPALGRALQAVVYPPHGRTEVGWDEFFSAARTAEIQRDADAALSTLSAATADLTSAGPGFAGPTSAGGSASAGGVASEPVAIGPVPSGAVESRRVLGGPKGVDGPVVDAAQVLELAAADLLIPATARVFPGLDPAQTAARAAELVKLLLALAAVRSGAARWRHSWTGAAELVSVTGDMLDLGELAELAVRPGEVEKLRGRLAELGIDAAAAAQDGSARTAGRAGVVGGVVNVHVDGVRSDVLVVETGLLFVPGVPRSRAGTAKRRLAELAADDAGGRDVAGSRFVAYADVATAARTRRTPRTWRITMRDGSVSVIRAGLDSEELPGGWAALNDAVIFLDR